MRDGERNRPRRRRNAFRGQIARRHQRRQRSEAALGRWRHRGGLGDPSSTSSITSVMLCSRLDREPPGRSWRRSPAAPTARRQANTVSGRKCLGCPGERPPERLAELPGSAGPYPAVEPLAQRTRSRVSAPSAERNFVADGDHALDPGRGRRGRAARGRGRARAGTPASARGSATSARRARGGPGAPAARRSRPTSSSSVSSSSRKDCLRPAPRSFP